MPPNPRLLLLLWLCSVAAGSRIHGHGTKATFSPHHESAAADKNAQSRGGEGTDSWSDTVNAGHAGPRGSGAIHDPVRKSDRQSGTGRFQPASSEGALRTDGTSQRGASDGTLSTDVNKTVHPQTTRGCRKHSPSRVTCGRRPTRGASHPTDDPSTAPAEDPPAPMAQEQDPDLDAPFGLNISDYDPVEEAAEEGDYPDPTPLLPRDPRTRRKQVRNPFYPVTVETYGAYAVLLFAAVIFCVGIVGNVSVMCIVCHNYYMRSISNSLLANMALWDFVIVFFCLPLVLFHELTKNWLLGEFSCRIIPYLEVASLGVTTFTLCALCIDRFRAATNVQLYYEMIENWASTAAKLSVIWVGALLLALPELLIRQLEREEEAGGAGEAGEAVAAACERCVIRISTQLPDTLYVLGLTYHGARLWWFFGCYFCLPTLFTIFSSLLTARRIRLAERACVRGGGGGTGAAANKKQIQLESQMNCTVVALAILYGFCIIPENIHNIVGAYMAAGVPRRALDVLALLGQLLLFCKAAAAPVLLFALCRPFTRAFLDCCCCCCAECASSPSGGDAAADECNTTELELSPFSSARRQGAASSSTS